MLMYPPNIMYLDPTKADALAVVTDAQFRILDDHRFVAALNLGLSTTTVSVWDLAQMFNMNPQIVAQWSMGYALPAIIVRERILKLFLDKLATVEPV